MRVVRMKNIETGAEYVAPLAATEAIANAIHELPAGQVIQVTWEDMDEREYHARPAVGHPWG